ncbi:MAG: hypothetical protein ABR567_11740 [Myxococcales bacterium]|nr:hypothetical protein [Myxococcales bacterium]
MTKKLVAGGVAALFLCATASFAKTDPKTGEKHHSLAKGAAVGAVGGHFVGKGHAKAGAAAGALYQHHKNKKAEKKAAQAPQQ